MKFISSNEYRWECPCGRTGPWKDTVGSASNGGIRHMCYLHGWGAVLPIGSRTLDWKPYRKRPMVVQVRGPIDKEETIETLEGKLHASVGDYIIRGVNDELYPIKPDIFKQTYEPVDE